MPLRVLLTGKLHGPDIGGSISLIYKASQSGAVSLQLGFVSLDERIKILKEVDWNALNKDAEAQPESVATVTH
jgi:glutamyl-tRNA synthetase